MKNYKNSLITAGGMTLFSISGNIKHPVCIEAGMEGTRKTPISNQAIRSHPSHNAPNST